MLPRPKHGGFGAFLPRFQPSSPKQQDWLWCGFALTFGQTRSGSGDAKASGHDLPLIRAFEDALVCCPQARLRTFPVGLVLGTRGSEVCWIQIGGQKRRVEVALHWPHTAAALMPALGQRLFDGLTTAMAKLRQFGAARGELTQGAAGTCNRASQVVYEYPWGVASHALAILLLPGSVGELFGPNRVATLDDLMN